jgi:hypothetical protein
MTYIATIHTAHCPRRPSAAARHRTCRAQGLQSHCPLLDAPRAYDLTPDAVSRPHTPGLRTPQICRAAGAVVPRCARCPRQRRSSAHCSRVCDTTPERGARCIHSPSHTLFPSPPARDDHLWDCPTLFFPDACSSRAAPLARATHPLRVQRLPAFPIVPVALIAARHTTIVFSRVPPSSLGASASMHPQPGVHDHRRAQRPPRSFLLVGVPRCLRSRCDVFGAIPLQACTRYSAETRRAASASSAAYAAPVPIACIAFVASPHRATFLVVF